jgi:hypothetical protein
VCLALLTSICAHSYSTVVLEGDVTQVLASPLPSSASSSMGGLSEGAKLGFGIGLGLGVPALLAVVVRRHKKFACALLNRLQAGIVLVQRRRQRAAFEQRTRGLREQMRCAVELNARRDVVTRCCSEA